MARQKERTLEDLLKKTRKLIESRPSCVLEENVRMRGPGVNDKEPSADSASREVCDISRGHTHETDLQICSACDRECQSSCLEPPINEAVVVDWHCSECQGTSSYLHPASELSLDSPCPIQETKATLCNLDPKVDGTDELSNGEILGSQDTSCLGGKPLSSVEDGLKKTLENPDGGQVDETEAACLPELEEMRKSSRGIGEPSEQQQMVEYVRRRKRGRPYKPVGGLHPNKRRSVDSTSRQTDKLQQGRSKPVMDEEDELGGKVEKFRVISTIDEKCVRKGPPDWEDSKRADLGQDLEWDEEDDCVPAISVTEEHEEEKGQCRKHFEGSVVEELADSATKGRNSQEDHKPTGVSPRGSVDSTSPGGSGRETGKAKRDAGIKLEGDALEGLSSGSLPLNGVQRDGQGRQSRHSLQESKSTLCEEKLGAELAEKLRQVQVRAEHSIITELPTSHEVLGNKDGSTSASGPSDTNCGMKMVENVHLASPGLGILGSILLPLDTSNGVHIVNDTGPLDNMSAETSDFRNRLSEDELKMKESFQSEECGKELSDLVLNVKREEMGKDFERVSKTFPKVEDAALDRHSKGQACSHSGETKPMTTITSAFEDQSAPSSVAKAGETGDAVIPAALASTASPGLVDSTDRTCIRALPAGRSRNSEEVELAVRGVQSASLEEEDDVKVCDICGDAGYEECLTICSSCNEGAEHIYCMQALIYSVPEDGWLCEECNLKEKDGNLKKAEDLPRKDEVPSKTVYPSPKKKQIIKGNTRSRLSALLDKGKGSSPQKVATKGLGITQLSTKRPADDDQISSSMKKQVREDMGISSTVTGTFTPWGLTRETSLKAPDYGKVKFLSPGALASCPLGRGGRNLGKSSSFVGLSSQSFRPGSNQLSQVASKNRYVPNSSASSDSAVCGAVTPKQPPTVRRPPSVNALAPPPSACRGGGSLKSSEPVPSFLLPSRSGSSAATAKGSKEGNSEGNGLQSLGRGTASQLAGGEGAKGWGAMSSGKMTTKRIDTPRPTMQSSDTPKSVTFCGRQFSMKGDSSTSSQSLSNTGMPGRPPVCQKRSQTMDPAKGVKKLTSFSCLPNQQSSRDENQGNLEVQAMRSSRKLPKVIDYCDSGTQRVDTIVNLPMNSHKPSSEDSLDSGLGRRGDQQADVSKIPNSDPPGTVALNVQKSTRRASHNEILISEDGKKLSKASMRAAPMKYFVVDDIPKGSAIARTDLKWKDNIEIGWSSVKNRRLDTCKDISDSAQACSNRSTSSTLGLADLCASSFKGPAAIRSPKEDPGGLSTSLLGQRPSDGPSLGERKSAVTSFTDPASVVSDIEFIGSVLGSETSTVVRQGQSKNVESGVVGEVSKYSTEDKRKTLPTPLSLSQGGTLVRVCTQSGLPAAIPPSGGFQSVAVGKSGASSDLQTSVRTDGISPVPVSISHVRQGDDLQTSVRTDGISPVPVSISHVRQGDGVLRGDSAALGASTEAAQRSDTGPKTVQEVSPRLVSENAQGSFKQVNTLGQSVAPFPLPPPPLRHPWEPSLPTPMMRQMRGPVPWGGQLPSPRPIGFDTFVNEESWGKRVGNVVGQGFAVPESQCLWRGGFEVVSAAVPALYDGIQAYSSSFAAPQVRVVTKTLPSRLQLEEVQRMFSAEAWPVHFQRRPPTDKEIALYFFPGSESISSFDVGYMRLLEHMMAFDLVLIGQVEGADLLIFPSHLLPVEFHHWKSKLFLWGVYRARKSNAVVKSMPLDVVQTSTVVPLDPSMRPPIPNEPEKVVPPGTQVITSIDDAGEVDMEIDMIGDTELNVPCYSSIQKPVCVQPPSLSCPPLPHEPPPVQPPPPDLTAPVLQEGAVAQATSILEITSKQSDLDLDLPPGFGPGPLKQAPPLSGPSAISSTPSGPPELKPDDSGGPPGFEKPPPGFEGVMTVQTLVHAEDTAGSTTDVDNLELTSSGLVLKRVNNIAEQSRPAMSSRQTSPLPNPSPSPRDLRDDCVGTFRLSTHRHSQSSSMSPNRHRDRIGDRGGGRTSFNGRESARGWESGRRRESVRDFGHPRESGKDRERVKDRDRGRGREGGGDRETGRNRERGREHEKRRDREMEREKENERKQDRWHHREREKVMEKGDNRSFGRDRGKPRDYGRDREKERRYQQRTRSSSQSQSRSGSVSTSRPRLQSLSVSPPKRRSAGKSHSRHRSRSYSDSPDSIHGRLWRKPRSSDGPTGSRELSQDGISFSSRKGASHLDQIDRKFSPRDTPEGDPCHISRLSAFSRERSLIVRDSSRKEEVLGAKEPLRNPSSIPFYDIHGDGADAVHLDCAKEKSNAGTVPYFHVFLPTESDDMQIFENDRVDHVANRSKQPSPYVLKHPQSDAPQSCRPWEESDKVTECPGYEFFPVKGGNVGELRKPSTNPNLDLVLGERQGTVVDKTEPQPFFVQLVDPAGSSPEHPQRYAHSIGPSDVTVEFPLVASIREEPARPDVNLSLSVPQYRKEGNAWVKIEDAQAVLGVEDVNFALTL